MTHHLMLPQMNPTLPWKPHFLSRRATNHHHQNSKYEGVIAEVFLNKKGGREFLNKGDFKTRIKYPANGHDVFKYDT